MTGAPGCASGEIELTPERISLGSTRHWPAIVTGGWAWLLARKLASVTRSSGQCPALGPASLREASGK